MQSDRRQQGCRSITGSCIVLRRSLADPGTPSLIAFGDISEWCMVVPTQAHCYCCLCFDAYSEILDSVPTRKLMHPCPACSSFYNLGSGKVAEVKLLHELTRSAFLGGPVCLCATSAIGVHKAKKGPKAKYPKAKEPTTKGHAGTCRLHDTCTTPCNQRPYTSKMHMMTVADFSPAAD